MEFKSKFEEICKKYNDKTSIFYMKDDGTRVCYSYDAILKEVESSKKTFENIGLRPGDRAAIITPHSPYGIITCLSLAWNGMTSVLIDASLPPEEINRMIKIADVRAIFTVEKILQFIPESLTDKIPVLELGAKGKIYSRRDEYSELVRLEKTKDPDFEVIAILFSSGTTSSAKGVMLTHNSVWEAAKFGSGCTGIGEKGKYLHILPFNHLSGFSTIFSLIICGCEIGMLEEVSALKIQKGFQEYHPSYFGMIPKAYEVFEQKIRQEIHSQGLFTESIFNIMLAVSGFIRKNFGVNLGKYIFKNINKKAFGGGMIGFGAGAAACKDSMVTFYLNLGYCWSNLYGSTETGMPAAATSMLDNYPCYGNGNIHKFSNVDIKINNPDKNGTGEIFVKTPLIMKGYFREPELTEAAFDNGYFKTGDLGYIDKKHQLIITGRMKETIILHNAKKVSPIDVEQYYNNLAEDVVVYCCGISNKEKTYDEIHLFIESKDRKQHEKQQIITNIMNLSSQTSTLYKIAKVHFTNKIPMTSVGKVMRYKLKELALLEKNEITPIEANTRLHENNDLDIVLNIISQLTSYKDKEITTELNLIDDLGFDSLTMFEMCAQIESTLGVDIVENLSTVKTIQDLLNLIQNNDNQSKHNIDNSYKLDDFPVSKKKRHVIAMRMAMKFSKLFWKFEIIGAENIPKDSNYIICPNHQSHLDGLWVWTAININGTSKICCMAKQEHLNHKISRFALTMLGGIPVDRTGNTAPAMKRCLTCIKDENYNVLIHPEGTRTRNGKINEFKSGAAKLAMDSGVPIVPVKIDGALEIYSYNKLLPKIINWRKLSRYPLKIHFGQPICPEGKSVQELTEILKRTVDQLGSV